MSDIGMRGGPAGELRTYQMRRGELSCLRSLQRAHGRDTGMGWLVLNTPLTGMRFPGDTCQDAPTPSLGKRGGIHYFMWSSTHALMSPTFFASTGSVSRSRFCTSPDKAR
jgi:hypothetical protein